MPQNGSHRHLAGRVQVPLTTPVEPAASASTPTLGWNEPPDTPGPQREADFQPRFEDRRSARPRRPAIALGTLLLMALITTVAVTSIEDPSTNAGVPGTHAASAHADNAALLPARPLTLTGLAVEIDKLTSAIDLTGSTTQARREATRDRHATARHGSHSAAVDRSKARHAAQPSRSPTNATSHAAATPTSSTTSNNPPSYQPQPTVTQAPATQQASSTQPVGPTGSGAAFGPGY